MTSAQEQIAALIEYKKVSYQWVAERLGWSKQTLHNKVNSANDLYTDDYNKIITLLNRIPSSEEREKICSTVNGAVLQMNVSFNSNLEKLNALAVEITADSEITPEENLRLMGMLDNLEFEIEQKLREVRQKFSGAKQ